MIKRLAVAILVLTLAVAAGAVAGCGGSLPSDAVAKVGDTLIMKADFDQRVQEFATQYSVTSKDEDPQGWAQFESEVLEYLVDYQMCLQKSQGYGITGMTDAEFQTEIDQIIANPQYYNGDKDAFNKDLAAHNMTLDELKQNYQENDLMQKVYNKVIADVPDPTDEQIAAYYDANKDTYYVDETRTTRHILIAPGTSETNPTTTSTTAPWGVTTTQSTSTTSSTSSSTTSTSELTDADWSKALAIAQKVRQMLVEGGDWKRLAAEYSDDSGTADSGGDLGNVSKGQMVQEFEDAVFSLKVNEISQPIKTTYGYHIIQVTAINPAKQYTLDDVKDDIKSTLLNQAKSDAWTQWLADTKVDLHVTYQKGYEPTTTTSLESTTTTVAAGSTGTTAAGESITTEAATSTTAKQ